MKNPLFRLAFYFFGFLLTLSCQDTKSSNQKEITVEQPKQTESVEKSAETEELKEDCGCGHGSDCNCGPECDCRCNAVSEAVTIQDAVNESQERLKYLIGR